MFAVVLNALSLKAQALEAADCSGYLRVIGIDVLKPDDFRARPLSKRLVGSDGYEIQRRLAGASASTFLKVTEIRRPRVFLCSFRRSGISWSHRLLASPASKATLRRGSG